MANEEQLAILKKGVKTWNEWRAKNREEKIDLGYADLRKVNLEGINLSYGYLIRTILSEANLEGARFSGTDLSYADFSGASLKRADLRGATLGGANLDGVDLSLADLRYAQLYESQLIGALLKETNLREADLEGANLSEAALHSTNFNGARLKHTDLNRAEVGMALFDNIDLSQVKGLETVRHVGPSTIGIDTIYKSKGKIPEVFLCGCGVPENFIVFMNSLAGQDKVFDFYSCFISYSSKDKEFAKRLHADLQSKGIRVWFAPEDLKIGARIQETIEDAIRIYDKLLIVLSSNSIESAWIEHEIKTAFKKEDDQKRTVLFPVRLDNAVMETTQQWAFNVRRNRNLGDFSKWKNHDDYQKSLERLVRDLQADSAK